MAKEAGCTEGPHEILAVTDGYSRLREDEEFRREVVEKIGTGFALPRTISTIGSLRSLGNLGRPPRHFHRQKSRKACRCQPIRVSGFTTTRALRQENLRDQNSVEPRRIRQPSRLTVPLLIQRQLFPKKEIFRNQGRLGLDDHSHESKDFS